jgi:hypothetical protein
MAVTKRVEETMVEMMEETMVETMVEEWMSEPTWYPYVYMLDD